MRTTSRFLALLVLIACDRAQLTRDDNAASTSARASAVDASTPRPPDVSLGCKTFAEAMCTAWDRCGTDPLETLAQCEVRVAAECVFDNGQLGSRADDTFLIDCSKRLLALSCPVDRNDPTCKPPAGELAMGKTCVSDAQCASGYCKTTKGECGTCEPPRPREKERAIGEPCEGSGQCRHAICDRGRCKEEPKRGEKCLGESKDECGGGLACSKGKCQPITVRALGEACSVSNGIFSFSPSGPEQCATSLACVEKDKKNRCIARPQIGEACDASSAVRCIWPARCIDAKCAVPRADSCK